MKRHRIPKERFQPPEVDARRFKAVHHGHHEHGGDRRHIHALPSVKKIVEERQNNERHAQGIEEHQNRNRRRDDRLQTEKPDQIGNDRKDRHPGKVRELAGQFQKVSRAAGNESDRGRETRKKHHHRQQKRPGVSEEMLGAQSQNRRSRVLHTDHRHTFRADLRHKNIDEPQHAAREQSALIDLVGNFARVLKPGFAHGRNDERPEDQGHQAVQRVVTVQNALHGSHRRRCVRHGRLLRGPHRGDEGLHDEDDERQHQRRRQNLTDAIHQLRRRGRKPIHDAEKDRKENRKRYACRLGRKKRPHRDFKRNRPGARHGKAGTDREITHHGVDNAVHGVHAARQGLRITRTGKRHGNHAQKRQSHAGNAEPQKRPPDVDAGTLAHGRGENQVAGAEKEREKHETDRHIATVFGGRHKNDSLKTKIK